MSTTNPAREAEMSFMDQKRMEIEERLEELRPIANEVAQLEAALRALDAATEMQKRDGAQRTGRAPGEREAAVLELLEKRYPEALTVKMIGEELEMGTSSTYLYRALPRMAEKNLVKQGTVPNSNNPCWQAIPR